MLSSIHHRDQARLYAKQIHEGQPELELSPEEDEAVRLALEGDGQPAPDRVAAAAHADAMRVGYLGPEGTFTHEAAARRPRAGTASSSWSPLPTIYDT